MILHLTDRERARISLKLYGKDKNLWRKYEEIKDRYERAENYRRWFYRSIEPDKPIRDVDYYIERHKRKHEWVELW